MCAQFNKQFPEYIQNLLNHSKFRISDREMVKEMYRLLGDVASEFSPREVEDLVEENLLGDSWDDSALIRLRGWGFWPEGEPEEGDRIHDVVKVIKTQYP